MEHRKGNLCRFLFKRGAAQPMLMSLSPCRRCRSTDQPNHEDACVHLSTEEKLAAEESLTVYCMPVAFYNNLRLRAIENVLICLAKMICHSKLCFLQYNFFKLISSQCFDLLISCFMVSKNISFIKILLFVF